MSNQHSQNSNGGSLLGLLTIVFITLRLCHVITWSWVWVLAPTWIPFAFVVIVLLVAMGVAVAKANKR